MSSKSTVWLCNVYDVRCTHHEKNLAERSELAKGGSGSKEEEGERDLDDVRRLRRNVKTTIFL